MNYGQWTDEIPDWHDVGKKITAESEDGKTISGVLAADEFWTGEDEFAVFYIETEKQGDVSLFDFTKWRIEK